MDSAEAAAVLKHDTLALEHIWADGFTVGKVAEEAIAGMRERLAQGGAGGEEQAARAGGT